MLRVFLAAAAAILVYRLFRAERPSGSRHIRDAGPSQMRAPPRNWDMLDEIGDESFPASDPPGIY